MQKIVLIILFLFFPTSYSSITAGLLPEPLETDPCKTLYAQMQLENIVDYTAFEQAVKGYQAIDSKKKEVLALADFSKPSTEERFYVLDMKNHKMLYSSHVAHGRNSGENYATSFSNEKGSFKSSLGFYVTEDTYQGKNGYSLILNGLEKGINDRAKERAIVIHSAAYSNPSVIASTGRLGRSLGCPALPESVSRPIIDVIKNGAVLFIYANDNNYLSQSIILPNDRPML